MNRLTHQRFSTGEVGVRLDPEAALEFEDPGCHGRLHPGEELRIVLLDPLELLWLARSEAEIRMRVQQVHLCPERAVRLAPRLPDGPQPRHVEVRMAQPSEGDGRAPRPTQHRSQR